MEWAILTLMRHAHQPLSELRRWRVGELLKWAGLTDELVAVENRLESRTERKLAGRVSDDG